MQLIWGRGKRQVPIIGQFLSVALLALHWQSKKTSKEKTNVA